LTGNCGIRGRPRQVSLKMLFIILLCSTIRLSRKSHQLSHRTTFDAEQAMSTGVNRGFSIRWLDEVDTLIRGSRNNVERNVLFAKKSFILARHSQIEEAKLLIQNLRAVNAAYEARLSSWIMFAEGIIEFSETGDIKKSKDRVIRGHLIGQLIKETELASTSAAWLGYFDFVLGKYQDSVSYIEKAFSLSTEQFSEARARASIVVADAFSLAGDLANGRAWYQRARSYAVASGDIAFQNITLFNASAHHIGLLTVGDCTSAIDQAELRFASMSSASAANFNAALGISSQPSLIPLQRAEIAVLERRWEDAIRIFTEHLDLVHTQGYGRLAPRLRSQLAWCKANSGDLVGATAEIEIALRDSQDCKDPDDLGVLYFRAAGVARIAGDIESARARELLGEEQLVAYSAEQSLIKALFDDVAVKIEAQRKNPAQAGFSK
jgi:tetratricopeptide (TPR) repeat protein